MVWREALDPHRAESRRAILKLRVPWRGNRRTNAPGTRQGCRVRDAAFEPLNQALDKHVIVLIRLPEAGGERSTRSASIAPIALIQHQGRWLLHGQDLDAGSNTVTFFCGGL